VYLRESSFRHTLGRLLHISNEAACFIRKLGAIEKWCSFWLLGRILFTLTMNWESILRLWHHCTYCVLCQHISICWCYTKFCCRCRLVTAPINAKTDQDSSAINVVRWMAAQFNDSVSRKTHSWELRRWHWHQSFCQNLIAI